MLLLLVGSYYLPLFYQAKVMRLLPFSRKSVLISLQGHSATKSGIDILPFMICILVGAALSGAIINVSPSCLRSVKFISYLRNASELVDIGGSSCCRLFSVRSVVGCYLL
jgi:hypothetical protein